jgi:hypothetical protein
MKRFFVLWLAAGMYLSGQSLDQKLTIRLYNLTGGSTAVVCRTENVAGQILAQAGVMVIWEKGSPGSVEGRIADISPVMPGNRSVPDPRGYLVVRLENGIPADPYGADLPVGHF